MFTCNVGFSRSVRKPHRKTRIECRNVQNVTVDMDWDKDSFNDISDELMKHRPEGEGWHVAGFARID